MFNKIIALCAVAFVIFAIMTIIFVPTFQLRHRFNTDPDKPNERVRLENELRATLVQCFGGIFVLFGLWVGFLNLRTLQDGQLTGRLTKAVEQLSSDQSSVRLGGIFSLERIARESVPEKGAVFEILSAYVRERSVNHNNRDEIKAVMLVIGRREVRDSERDASSRLNLAGVNLNDVDLSGGRYVNVNFSKALFQGSTLTGAKFESVDMSDCTFDKAYVSKAVFIDADLRRASFLNASLFGVKLRGADLSGAKLNDANLWASDLTDTDLRGASLLRSFFLGATFKRTKIQGANFQEAIILSLQLNSAEGAAVATPARQSPAVPKIRGIVHSSTDASAIDSVVTAGEFLTVYCGGLGDLRWPDPGERTPLWPRAAESPIVTIDSTAVSVIFAGVSPSYPATYQVNVHVPSDLAPGAHVLSVAISNGQQASIRFFSA